MKKNVLTDLKEKEREIRKNIILDAAVRIFSTKPYDKVSMREIALEAGIAKSSIYTYFPNQESLFISSAIRDLKILLDSLHDKIFKKNDVKIDEVINSFINYFLERDSFYRMTALFMLQGKMSDESLNILNPELRKMMDSFDQIFIKIGYDGNVRLMSHTLFAFMSGILISYNKYPGRTEKEIKRHMQRLSKNVNNMFMSIINK